MISTNHVQKKLLREKFKYATNKSITDSLNQICTMNNLIPLKTATLSNTSSKISKERIMKHNMPEVQLN